ncbi:uncharacterized protein LOC142337629 isoform X3 [Convolutriloba macropyga]|uniref:uncharacterized protein LOC142337629 isoform X3 n=1 Tax=Convolutriloba macropyga TaxID=536237 RepID=UPI003F51E462
MRTAYNTLTLTVAVFAIAVWSVTNGDSIHRISQQTKSMTNRNRQFQQQIEEEDPLLSCMEERDYVKRYHVYKANAADYYVTARILSDKNSTWKSFSKKHPEFLLLEEMPKETAPVKGKGVKKSGVDENDKEKDKFGDVIIVDTSLSSCEMKMKQNQYYMVYLKATKRKTNVSIKDAKEGIDEKREKKVWIGMAEPTKYSPKKSRELVKYLTDDSNCKECQKEPYMKEVHKLPPVVETKLKQKVKMECRARGFPQPYMYWTHEGRPMHPGKETAASVNITTTWKRSILEISYVRWQHLGNYSCVGTMFKPDIPDVTTTTQLSLSQAAVSECGPEMEGYCLNNGKCFFSKDHNMSVCHCVEAYVGTRCQFYSPYGKRGQSVVGDSEGWGSMMVPIRDVIVICLIIVSLAVLFLISACLYISHKNRKQKSANRKMFQSLDYSYNIAPGQLKKKGQPNGAGVNAFPSLGGFGNMSAGGPASSNRTEILLTNSFMKRPRNQNGAVSGSKSAQEALEDLFGTGKSKKKSRGHSFSSAVVTADMGHPMLSQNTPVIIESSPNVSAKTRKEQLVLPIRIENETATAGTKNGLHEAMNTQNSSPDGDEERSRKSDETDCTVTNEHHVGKETNNVNNNNNHHNGKQAHFMASSNVTPRHMTSPHLTTSHSTSSQMTSQQPRDQNKGRQSSQSADRSNSRVANYNNGNQGRKVKRQNQFDDSGNGQKTYDENLSVTGSADILSDDDSPSPMSCSDMSLTKFL